MLSFTPLLDAGVISLPRDVIAGFCADPICARELASTCRWLSEAVPRRLFRRIGYAAWANGIHVVSVRFNNNGTQHNARPVHGLVFGKFSWGSAGRQDWSAPFPQYVLCDTSFDTYKCTPVESPGWLVYIRGGPLRLFERTDLTASGGTGGITDVSETDWYNGITDYMIWALDMPSFGNVLYGSKNTIRRAATAARNWCIYVAVSGTKTCHTG